MEKRTFPHVTFKNCNSVKDASSGKSTTKLVRNRVKSETNRLKKMRKGLLSIETMVKHFNLTLDINWIFIRLAGHCKEIQKLTSENQPFAIANPKLKRNERGLRFEMSALACMVGVVDRGKGEERNQEEKTSTQLIRNEK